MTPLPRFIRAKNAPAYLGMDRNKFNAQIKPRLTVIELGPQSRAYDRLDLDAIADEIKSRNGRPPRLQTEGTTIWQGKERQDSSSVVKPGISTSRSKGMDDFAKALATVTTTKRTSTSRPA